MTSSWTAHGPPSMSDAAPARQRGRSRDRGVEGLGARDRPPDGGGCSGPWRARCGHRLRDLGRATESASTCLSAGQAWHWIDPIYRARERPPGCYGRAVSWQLFWNFAQLEPAALTGRQRCLRRRRPGDHADVGATGRWSGHGSRSYLEILRRSGGFGRIERRQYRWEQQYGRGE